MADVFLFNMINRDWMVSNACLEKTFRFESFIKAIEFMKRASIDIDTLNHHPEWTNIYNKVTVTLRTHDAGNVVTDLDYRLAELLDVIYKEFEV